MERTRWSIVVGVIGLIIGIGGINSSVTDFMLPSSLEMSREMMESLAAGTEEQQSDKSESKPGSSTAEQQPLFPAKVFETFQKQYQLPGWFKLWSIVNGTVGLANSILYAVGALLILLLKPVGIRLFLIAASCAILWNVVQTVMATQASKVIVMSVLPGAIVGTILHLVLIAVIKGQEPA